MNSKIFSHLNYGNVKRFFFVLILVSICWPYSLYYRLEYGLDHSWMAAIHMAIKDHLIFGQDFIFTYGPLGFLATRLPIAVPSYVYILFDLYLLLNLVYVFNFILKRYNSLVSFITIFLIIILLQDFHDHDIVMVLAWILLFMLFHHFQHRKTYILVNASFLALVVFFIKVNLGIITIAILFIYLIFILLLKIKSGKYIALFGIGFVIGLISISYFLNVSLIGYLLGSLHIIDAYNDAMYESLNNPLADPTLISSVFIVCFIVVMIAVNIRHIILDPLTPFVCFVVLLLLYVEFKQGFVRLHTESFFQYATPFFALTFLFGNRRISRSFMQALFLVLFICFLKQGNISMFFGKELKQSLVHIQSYVKQVSAYGSAELDYKAYKDSQLMPSNILSDIKGSVDIIPWDITFLYYNNLDYNPRPVIQSYSAYDHYLDLKNASKFKSSTSPDFVLIQSASIDNRYALHDETETKLSLLGNYDLANASWDHALLKKVTKPLSLTKQNLKNGESTLSEYVKIDASTEIQIADVDIQYSFLGKVQRLLFQPPQLFISLITENGKKHDYKAITTILKGGVIINKFIPSSANSEEFAAFLSFNGQFTENIISFRLWSPQPWGFKPNYNYSISKINFNGSKESVNSYKPIEKKEIPFITNGVQFNIEKIKTTKELTSVNGWAFPSGNNSNNSSTYLTLKSESKSYVFATERRIRGDVSAAFKDSLDNSGFQASIINQFIDDGEYEVGIMIEKEHKIFFQYSGQKIKINKVAHMRIDRTLWIEDASIKFYFDGFDVNESDFYVRGWAFIENLNNSNVKIKIILESDSEVKVFPCQVEQRGDLNVAYNRKDLAQTGFNINIDRNTLSKADYKVGILIVSDDKTYTIFTNKTFSDR